MQLATSGPSKTTSPLRRCHTKSVITKPQNVFVMRDIMCSGYVAGGNTAFFGEKNTTGAANATPENIQASIGDRLAFTDDASGEYESMLAFAVPWMDGSKRDQVVSLSPRLLPWEVTARSGEQKSYFPGGKAHFEFYKTLYNLDAIHFGEDLRAAENMEFLSASVVNNTLCFLGPHRRYSPWSNTFQELVPGQGHFGPDALPGDARWRRGECVSLDSARNAMVSIEAAAHSQFVFNKAS